jgi:hypothetical protein
VATRNDPSASAASTELPSIEYRGAARHLILQRCFVWVPGGQGGEGLRCIAYNLSTSGIALAVPLPLQKGTILEVKPWELPDAPPVRARVVHAKVLEFLWCCGCELLTPLSETGLQAWLKGPRNWVQDSVSDSY